MHILKKLSRGLCSQIFKFSILTLAVVIATVSVFGTPKAIKSSISTSGMLEAARDSAIESAQKDKSAADSELDFSDPNVVVAFKNAFSTDFLQTNSNNVIDGFYSWLNGKTKVPEFSIDLKQSKQQLAESISVLAVNRVNSLPACTLQQLRALNPANIDPFTIDCQPHGINLSDVKAKVYSAIVSDNDFLKDAPITANDLPKDASGKSAFDNAQAVPQVFQWSKRLPVILTGLAIISAGLFIYLHDNRRRGVWLLARGTLITGIILLLSVLLTNYLVSNFRLQANGVNPNVQRSAMALVKSLTTSLNNTVLIFGIAYSVVGAGVLIYLHFTRDKSAATNVGNIENSNNSTTAITN